MRLGNLIVLGLVCGSSVCQAQAPREDWRYGFEVFGTLAHGRLYHGDSLLAKGREFGAGLGVRPFSGRLQGLGFEVQAGRLSRSESTPIYPVLTVDATMVTVNALYHFGGHSRFQPYVLGGIGLVRSDYYRKCTACVYRSDPVSGALVPLVTESRSKSDKGGVTLGGGLKIAVHRHIWLRPEVLLVDTTPGAGANLSWIRVQIGAGLHF